MYLVLVRKQNTCIIFSAWCLAYRHGFQFVTRRYHSGRLKQTYLQEHRQALFNHLTLSERLFPHLPKVDKQAQYLLDTMKPPMAKATGATEQLNATDQIRWVGLLDEYCATPQDLQEELQSSYRMNEAEKITKARRELTKEEIEWIEAKTKNIAVQCK